MKKVNFIVFILCGIAAIGNFIMGDQEWGIYQSVLSIGNLICWRFT
jgi:hypothetical protein